MTAAAAGAEGSIVELYTLNGADTIAYPLAALVVISAILWAFGAIKPVWV